MRFNSKFDPRRQVMLEQERDGVVAMDAAELQAFQVDEGFDGESTVVFASSRNQAKHLGAQALGIPYMDVESCRRKPEFDGFSPGPIPPLVLLASGWWFECSHCGERVTRAGDSSDEFSGEACESNGHIYCSRSCLGLRLAYERARDAAEAALCELVTTRFPGATVLRTRIAGRNLERADAVFGASWATFQLDGLQHPAAYQFGSDDLVVSPTDDAAYRERYAT